MNHRFAANYFLDMWETNVNTPSQAFEAVINDFFFIRNDWTENEIKNKFNAMYILKKTNEDKIGKDVKIALEDSILIHFYQTVIKHIDNKGQSGIGCGEHFYNYLFDTKFSFKTTADVEDKNGMCYEIKGINTEEKKEEYFKNGKLKKGKKDNNAPIRFIVTERWSGLNDLKIHQYDNDIKKVKISFTTPNVRKNKKEFDINKLTFIFMKWDGKILSIVCRTAKQLEDYVNNIFLKTPDNKGNHYDISRVTDWNHGIRFNFDQFIDVPNK